MCAPRERAAPSCAALVCARPTTAPARRLLHTRRPLGGFCAFVHWRFSWQTRGRVHAPPPHAAPAACSQPLPREGEATPPAHAPPPPSRRAVRGRPGIQSARGGRRAAGARGAPRLCPPDNNASRAARLPAPHRPSHMPTVGREAPGPTRPMDSLHPPRPTSAAILLTDPWSPPAPGRPGRAPPVFLGPSAARAPPHLTGARAGPNAALCIRRARVRRALRALELAT